MHALNKEQGGAFRRLGLHFYAHLVADMHPAEVEIFCYDFFLPKYLCV